MIDNLRQYIWVTLRDIKGKPLLCNIGWHKVRRGFGWSGNKRMDICLKCNWTQWYSDPNGCKMIKDKAKSTSPTQLLSEYPYNKVCPKKFKAEYERRKTYLSGNDLKSLNDQYNELYPQLNHKHCENCTCDLNP